MSKLIISKQGSDITVMADPGYTFRDWTRFVEAVKEAGLFNLAPESPTDASEAAE